MKINTLVQRMEYYLIKQNRVAVLSLWQKWNYIYLAPKTVTKLATVSFSSCKLNKLNLPNNLKYIDESAFTETSLKTLSIPESVEYIGRYAFDLSGIETIHIPKGITTIEEGTFTAVCN